MLGKPASFSKLFIGSLLFELPNGAACSPTCFGHYFAVIHIEDNEVELLALPYANDNDFWKTDPRKIYTAKRNKTYVEDFMFEAEPMGGI